MKEFLLKSFFQSKSRARVLQYEWLKSKATAVSSSSHGRVLDLGGVRRADYHALLNLDPAKVTVWNFSPTTEPDELVDLDRVDALPKFPKDCDVVLAINLLEHLYRPFDLLRSVCQALPSGGTLIVCTPFCYPIHPSPNDYWRIAPQAYEKFFSELAKTENINGTLEVTPLGEDLREAISLMTTPLHLGRPPGRFVATLVNKTFGAASNLAALFGQEQELHEWAQKNPVAIGVLWRKS